MVRDTENAKSPAKTPRNAVAVRFDGLTEGGKGGTTPGRGVGGRYFRSGWLFGGGGFKVVFFPDFSDLKA